VNQTTSPPADAGHPIPADTPLEGLDWIPRQRHAALKRLGLHTLADLLRHYPRRHENRRQFDGFPDAETPASICLRGVVTKASVRRFGGWRGSFEITLEESGGGAFARALRCRWFNMTYLGKSISAGDTLAVYGRPKLKGKQLVMDHPEYEVLQEDGERGIHLDRIAPIHPAGEGLSPKMLRSWIYHATARIDRRTLEPVTPGRGRITDYASALAEIHFPGSPESLEASRQLLASEELFCLSALLESRRAILRGPRSRPRSPAQNGLTGDFHRSLPFDLTGAQRRAIAEITSDLSGPNRMNRLLQGDVGSGKTVVALAAMLEVVARGERAALMAPTQVLAEQHAIAFRRMVAPLGIAVGLRMSGRSEGGELPPLLVGTHALIHGDDSPEFGLVVIDEQQKFGVLQRSKLMARGREPDVLVMSATPIPRTLAQTIYGDMDISILDELPKDRGRITTAVRDEKKLGEIVAFMAAELAAGRQAYIVYPLIDDSETLSAKAAAAEFERWVKLLHPHPVELLHGRIPPEERQATMERFRRGETRALVATTVIEVGVDVPNASIMLVESAERFGLSQLHQLRGRIGRGPHRSFCILMKGEATGLADEKLAILERTLDGFLIAEEDLRLRGPGDFAGTAQTGLPPLRLAALPRDTALLAEARALAARVLGEDPGLAEHPVLAGYLNRQKLALPEDYRID